MANLTAQMKGNPTAVDANGSQTVGQRTVELHNFWIINGISLYYMLMLVLSFRVMLDVWNGSYGLAGTLGMQPNDLQDPLLKTVSFAGVGGALGGILYNMRQLYQRVKRKQFDPIWIGKYLTMPLESAGMAVVVLALLQGGTAAVGGGSLADASSNNFAPFGLGALVGMGMRDVVEWVSNLVGVVFALERNNDGKKAHE